MQTDCCPHMALTKWPNHFFFYSSFTCLTLGNTLSAYNETPTLQGSPNKWRSQITEASQTCHRPSSSALIYKHCPWSFSAITNPTGMTIWMAVESDLLKKNRKRQTVLHNSKQKQMQRHSPVYNWFSRATSCCHSLSNEPLAGALLLVNHRMSDVAAVHRPTPTGMAPRWSTDITRLLFSFKILPGFFLKVFWVGEASQTSRGKLLSSPAADRRLALFTWTTGIFRPYGCQCLCLRSRVSLWASKAKPLIGHGSSITQSNPFHPVSSKQLRGMRPMEWTLCLPKA